MLTVGAPRRLDEILAQLISQKGYGRELSSLDCEEAWNELVGERLAKLTTPTRIRKGTLEVLVDNSTIVQELTFQKPHLVKSLGERLPDQHIGDLKFRVGKT